MTDWRDYWNTAPIVYTDDFLRQVGKTVNGRPVPEASLDAMANDVATALQLTARDRVFDLCCGNGLLTRRCARFCEHVTAVDFSAPLIRTAIKYFSAGNVTYLEVDVRDLPPKIRQEPFTKAYMYEALQHLGAADLGTLLRAMSASASRAAPLFIASVPDRERIWEFYDTPERRGEYQRRTAEDTEAIGHWWAKDELAALCKACGYAVEFRAPNPILHTAHYRFDALCSPLASAA